jgi:hypothetical protein
MSQEFPDDNEFIDTYGPNAPVASGMISTNLASFLLAEAEMCPADEDRRRDPYKRSRKLAEVLEAGGTKLIDDHLYLIREDT